MFLYQEQKCKNSFRFNSTHLEEEKERLSLITRILQAKSTLFPLGERSGVAKGKVETRLCFLIRQNIN